MRITIIILLASCLLITNVNGANANALPQSSQASTSSTPNTSTLSDHWQQVKATTHAHVGHLTQQVSSDGFWSQIGNKLTSYWQQTVTTVKGWFGA